MKIFAKSYKKMAGTSAVFLSAEYSGAAPVERDGMVWSAEELHLNELSDVRNPKSPMQNALALEGLEEYDMPQNGDVRNLQSVGADFVYFDRIQAWIQLL
ncbi:MAG: hypothetical protein O2971_01020 [Proteobacteria bacterium]|nr:hypothetical protein [Pseudomonadota bacterium]